MTLDVFPDPRNATDGVQALLTAAKAARWPTATISTSFPTSGSITVPHIQHAWDGSPSKQKNRQVCTIRVTCWTPKGKVSDGIALAQLVMAYLEGTGSASVWGFRDPVGPSHGTDDDTGLPFATFTIIAETRPTRVS